MHVRSGQRAARLTDSTKRELQRCAEAEKGLPAGRGWTRRRAGKGFIYLDESGNRLAAENIQRCKLLVIPPAWEQVWICPAPNGHLQAVGTDDAGRRQYIYHQQWRLRVIDSNTTGCWRSQPGCRPRGER